MDDDNWWLNDDMCDYSEANRRMNRSAVTRPPISMHFPPDRDDRQVPAAFRGPPAQEDVPPGAYSVPPQVPRPIPELMEAPNRLAAASMPAPHTPKQSQHRLELFVGPLFTGDPRSLPEQIPLTPWPKPADDLADLISAHCHKFGLRDSLTDAILRVTGTLPPLVTCDAAGASLNVTPRGVRYRMEVLSEETERVAPITAARPPHRVDLSTRALPGASGEIFQQRTIDRPPLLSAMLLAPGIPMQEQQAAPSAPLVPQVAYPPPQGALTFPAQQPTLFPVFASQAAQMPGPISGAPSSGGVSPYYHVPPPTLNFSANEPLPLPSPSIFSSTNDSSLPPPSLNAQPRKQDAFAACVLEQVNHQQHVSTTVSRAGSAMPSSEPSPNPQRSNAIESPLDQRPGESIIDALYRLKMSKQDSSQSAGDGGIGKPPLPPPSLRF